MRVLESLVRKMSRGGEVFLGMLPRYNTVSQQLSEDATCDIMFDFSYSEDFNKLYWNSAGPQ